MSSLLVKGGDAERIAEYRRRAERVLGHAAASTDERTRSWFIDIANNYLSLAEHIEQRDSRKAGAGRPLPATPRAHIERREHNPPHIGAAK